jgi:hypothetical protein
MSERPTEYDPRFCAIHEQTLNDIVDRVQKLVDEYHGNNVAVTEMRGQINLLTARVPTDLPQQLTSLSIRHDGLHKDFTLLRGQVYMLVGSVLLSLLGGLMTFILRGGLR